MEAPPRVEHLLIVRTDAGRRFEVRIEAKGGRRSNGQLEGLVLCSGGGTLVRIVDHHVRDRELRE